MGWWTRVFPSEPAQSLTVPPVVSWKAAVSHTCSAIRREHSHRKGMDNLDRFNPIPRLPKLLPQSFPPQEKIWHETPQPNLKHPALNKELGKREAF